MIYDQNGKLLELDPCNQINQNLITKPLLPYYLLCNNPVFINGSFITN